MSYLNVPRLHFYGNFQADPSTVNNNDNNWDDNLQLSSNQTPNVPPLPPTAPPNNPPGANTSVYWNPDGTHNWKLKDCTVTGYANDNGPQTAGDPIIGAPVLSSGKYPAKIVDLDPDNQCVSQIWGLQIQILIPGTQTSMTATMPPSAFSDLWARTGGAPGMSGLSASWQATLTDVVFNNVTSTNAPLLYALQQAATAAGNTLSIRFNVDSFQADNNQSNFTFGRVAGTIGPVLATDAPRSTARRLAPSFTAPSIPTIGSSYGPVGAVWDGTRSKLILDLGNCVPCAYVSPAPPAPSVPNAGWSFNAMNFQVTIPGSSVSPPSSRYGVKARGPLGCGAPQNVGTQIAFTTAAYRNFAGVVEVAVSDPSVATLLQSQPLTLNDVTSGTAVSAAVEDSLGRFVDVDAPFARINPVAVPGVNPMGINLWATKFGVPWVGAVLDVMSLPAVNNTPMGGTPAQPWSNNAGPWLNASPSNALTLLDANGNTVTSVTTGSNGVAQLFLSAADPGTPRTYPAGWQGYWPASGALPAAPVACPGPDGQVYWVTGSWANWGLTNLFPGSGLVNGGAGQYVFSGNGYPYSLPINVLVFSSYAAKSASGPTWTDDVGPILSSYARLYPYMKGIIDLGDYNTVKTNAAAIQGVLNLPPTNPHHMPITRDLSSDKLAVINQWFANGMPL